MSTRGLSLEILNSVEKTFKEKRNSENKEEDCQKLNSGGMKRQLSIPISDANIVFSNPIDGNRSSGHVSEHRIQPFSSGLLCLIEFNLSLLQIASPVAYVLAASHFLCTAGPACGQGRRRAPAAAHISAGVSAAANGCGFPGSHS